MTGAADDERLADLAEPRVGRAHDGRLRDPVEPGQHLLDLGGVHVEAAADVHVLDPAGDGQVPGGVQAAGVTGVQPAVRVDGGLRGLRVVQVAEHQVRPAEQDLAAVGDPHLEAGRRPPRRAGHRLRRIPGAAHRRHHGLGQPVGGEHDLEAQVAPHPLDQRDRDVGRAGDREAQAGQVTGAALGVVQDRGVDRRRAGEHGDPHRLDQPHRLPGVEDRLRHQRRPADQAGEQARLEAEGVEERVHHQVAVRAGQLGAVRPGPGDAQRPLVRGHRALAPPGRPGGEHDVADVPGTYPFGPLTHHRGRNRCPAPLERRPVLGHPHHQAEPVQRNVLGIRRGPERRQPVDTEEIPGHEQRPGPAPADHVQRLVPREPRADRDQYTARAERAQRGQHPITVVGRPDGHPVRRRHARRDERGGDRGHPLAQLAVAEPEAVRPRIGQCSVGQCSAGQCGRVAELPSGARHGARDRQLHGPS